MIRVLIVDDSLFMRKTLKRMFEAERDIEVVGLAENGRIALEKIEQLKPDVVTLDIEMPVLDGLETLKEIMAKNPIPVIMVSALTKEGADITMEALDIGACDFVTKDFSNVSLSLVQKKEELVTKVRHVAKRKSFLLLRNLRKRSTEFSKQKEKAKHDVLSIGASTGGPAAIQHIVTSLPSDFPCPIVVAQHMPKIFTLSFSQRLKSLSAIDVKEAENGENLRPGTCFIAPGGIHMKLKKAGKQIYIELFENNAYIYKPSVNVLILSCAEVFRDRTLCVILSGMGNDGLEGARELKKKGGFLIAQDETTSVVYGMPRAVVKEHLADLVLPITEIPDAIMRVI